MDRPMNEEPNATIASPEAQPHSRILVIEPADLNDCLNLIENLKAGDPVVVNLEHLETKVSHEVFGFLAGATYVLGGTAQSLNNEVFIFLPKER